MDIIYWLNEYDKNVNIPRSELINFRKIENIDNKFFHKSVLERINKYMRYDEIYLCKINNYEVKIHYIYGNAASKDIKNFIIWNVLHILNGLNELKPLEYNLNIRLIDLNKKKKMSKILDSSNINSGLTIEYNNSNTKDIYVYRREEMIKVLIHELLHAYNFENFIRKSENKRLKELFKLDRNIYIGETYIDTIACYINLIIYSLIESKLYYIVDKEELVKKNLIIERNHIFNQGHIILEHYKNNDNIINDDVNAIEYYVLKAILWGKIKYIKSILKENNYIMMNDFDEVILNCITNNKFFKYKQIKNKKNLAMTTLDIIILYKNKIT